MKWTLRLLWSSNKAQRRRPFLLHAQPPSHLGRGLVPFFKWGFAPFRLPLLASPDPSPELHSSFWVNIFSRRGAGEGLRELHRFTSYPPGQGIGPRRNLWVGSKGGSRESHYRTWIEICVHRVLVYPRIAHGYSIVFGASLQTHPLPYPEQPTT